MERNNQEEAALIAAQVDAERRVKFPFVGEDDVDAVLEWEETRWRELALGS